MARDRDIAIETVEMHCGGEPVRIVTRGYPPIPGATILDKRRHAKEHLDHLRRLLMHEPRGHADMYGVIPVEPDHADADLAVLFMHNEGYSTMCGHAVIALGRYAVERGLVAVREPETGLNIQCPCGLVPTRVAVEGGRAGMVTFESVPAYAFAIDWPVKIPDLGPVAVDIGYGGAFYAILPADVFGLDVRTTRTRDLVDAAERVTKAVTAQVPLNHPEDDDLAYLYGTILTDGREMYSHEPTRNVCVFADRQVDRSPTGSGVTARIAVQFDRGLIELAQTRTFESVTGTRFTGTPIARGRVGPYAAVTVEVGGYAYFCGSSRFEVEPDDPLGEGFLVR